MQKNGILLAIIFSLIGALVGGTILGLIVIFTDYEIGMIAWLIGLITGYAASTQVKGSNVMNFQIIAVITSLIGIVFGKYVYYSYFLSDYVNGEFGMFDSIIFAFFREDFTSLFAFMDIVFILLAIITAWQIPAKLADKHEVVDPEMETESEVN